MLKEIQANFNGGLAGTNRSRSTWGTGALASAVTLKPGQKVEVRFTLGWFFPNHVAGRAEVGHMYANWFKNAAEVNQFLSANYATHRAETEKFARTLPIRRWGRRWPSSGRASWARSSKTPGGARPGTCHLGGLGCCGLSTTDVDYDGSSSTSPCSRNSSSAR